MKHLSILDTMFNVPQAYQAHYWSENEGKYELEVDLPGMKKEDIDITLSDGYVKVEAKRFFKNQTTQTRSEYRNVFSLPRSINKETLSAEYETGVLKLTGEKLKQESNKIQVK